MDPLLSAQIAPAVIGGTAGFIGGAVVALGRATPTRQIAFAIIGGAGIGACFAPAIVSWFSLPLNVVAVLGFGGSLCVYGIVAGFETLSDRFGKNPERFLPEPFRSWMFPQLPPDQSPGEPKK